MKSKIIVLLISLLITYKADAQKRWTLQECVDYALQNNLSVKQTGISSELAQINTKQNFAALFPNVNASATESFNYGRSVDPTTNLYSNLNVNGLQSSLSADVTLFNGMRLQNTLKQSKLDYTASKFDMDKIKNDISMTVVANYLSVLYAKENLNAANDRVTMITKQRNNIKAQVEAGNLAQGNLLDLESQLAQEELGVVNSQNTLRQAYLSLTQIMNLDVVDGFEIDVPLSNVPDQSTMSLSPDAIFATSKTVMPEIKSSELKYESAEKGVQISKGTYYPRLSLFGQLSSNYSNQSKQFETIYNGLAPNGNYTASGEEVYGPDYTINSSVKSFNTQVNDNFNKAWGLSLSIPIFNGLSAKYNVQRSKLQQQNAGYTLDLQKQQLFKSIQQAHTDAGAAKSRFDASQKSLSALQLSFDYTQKKFNAGLLTSLDFITAQNNLSRAQSEVLQSKYDYIFRLKILDFYMGKPLGM